MQTVGPHSRQPSARRRTVAWLLLLAVAVVPVSCWAAAGQLDPTFGTGGTVGIGALGPDGKYACGTGDLVQQSDGKFVLTAGCSGAPVLVRCNADGSLDPTFGNGGIASVPYRNALALGLQPDGRIVVAGRSYWTPPSGWNGQFLSEAMTLTRFNSDGSLDATFGTGGSALPAPVQVRSLVVQPDGKLVTAGLTNPNRRYMLALVRYNLDGSFDETFGTGGTVITDFGDRYDVGWGIVLQPDGKLVTNAIAPFDDGVQLARYNPDGSTDETFGDHGIASLTFWLGPCGVIPHALVLQPDGKLVSGSSSTACGFGLARFNADGSIDTSFGTGGTVSTALLPDARPSPVYGLLIEPDGKIVAAGFAAQSYGRGAFALARYNPDGSLDSTFGNSGIVLPALVFRSIVRQPDSRLVSSFGVLARYTNGVCGNGIPEPGEDCDDGNSIDGDGCDSNCTYPACGNGILDPDEECDDANITDGDGCSATCQLQLIPGGGPASTDCLAEWGVVNPNNRPLVDKRGRMSRKQVCVDNDPTCDFDGGVVGSCTFHVKVCVNVADLSLPRCAAAPLVDCEVMKPTLRDSFRSLDLAHLRTRIYDVAESTMGAPSNTCSPPIDVTVPTFGTRPGRQVVRMRMTAATGKRDIDTLGFTCKP